MRCSSFLSFFFLPSALAIPGHLASKRAGASNATLYAYGADISGNAVLYNADDGKLYVTASSTTPTGLHAITWDIPALSTAASTPTTGYMANGISPGKLGLDTASTSEGEVSVSANGTTGIALYGKQLVYVSGSQFEAKFWAKKVKLDGSDAYVLTWNVDNVAAEDTTPVNIKTDAPASVSN